MTKTTVRFLSAFLGLCVITSPVWSQNEGMKKERTTTSEFRLVNLHPDIPAVRVVITSNSGSEQVLTEHLEYPSASPVGRSGSDEDTVKIQRADGSNTLATYVLRAAFDRSYILAALPIGPSVLVQSFFRDLKVTPPQGKGFVQFLQASPDAMAVEVEITDSKGHTITLNASGFGSPTFYDTTLASGNISVVVRKQQSKELLIEGAGNLPSGVFATVILSGKVTDSTLILSLLDQSNVSAQEPLYRLDRSSSTGFTNEKARGDAVAVIPNPARDRLRIVWGSAQKGSAVRLYDLLGRDVLGRPVPFELSGSGSIEIDVSELRAGTYRAVIEGLEGTVLAVRSVVVVR